MNKAQSTSSNKWKEVIGCHAEFDSKGVLNIFRNGKVVRLEGSRRERMVYMICQFDRFNVFYTADGFATLLIPKKFTKIV